MGTFGFIKLDSKGILGSDYQVKYQGQSEVSIGEVKVVLKVSLRYPGMKIPVRRRKKWLSICMVLLRINHISV